MRLTAPAVRHAALLGGALLASACATVRSAEWPEQGGSTLVATSEPLVSPGDSLPPQPAVAGDERDPLASAMSHMVANDGMPEQLPWRPGIAPVSTACAMRGEPVGAGPLEERGVVRGLDGLGVRDSWVLVGLAFGGDGVSPLLYAGPCGGAWLGLAPRSRIGRLAPDVSGRDTSVLFSTSRAEMPVSGTAGVIGAVARWLTRATSEPSAEPRTAKPRDQGEPVREPAAAPTAAPAPAPAQPPAAAPAREDPPPAPPRTASPRGRPQR